MLVSQRKKADSKRTKHCILDKVSNATLRGFIGRAPILLLDIVYTG